MKKKKTTSGPFGNLFDNIQQALNNLKKKFSNGEDGNEWLKKPHANHKDLVLTADPLMWLTFWLPDNPVKEKVSVCYKKMTWYDFIYNQGASFREYCKVDLEYPIRDGNRDGKIKTNLNGFRNTTLANSKYASHLFGKITAQDIDDIVHYSCWFLYNQFYAIYDETGKSSNNKKDIKEKKACMIAYPQNDDDVAFFKALLILWHLFFVNLSCRSSKIDEFLYETKGFISQKDGTKLSSATTAEKLVEIYNLNLPENSTYRSYCEYASKLFWELVGDALASTSSREPVKSIYSFEGGTSMNEKYTVDPYMAFIGNPVLQKVYSAGLEDYVRIGKNLKPMIDTLCTEGEITSYLAFFNNLKGVVNTEAFMELLGFPFALIVNNPIVQDLYFDNFGNELLFNHIEDIYAEYIYNVFQKHNYADNPPKNDFQSTIPLMRYSLLDSAVVKTFMKRNTAEFKLRKFGENFGKFRLRAAESNDIDKMLDIQSKKEEDKKIYFHCKEDELTVAVRNKQLFVIEDLKEDVDYKGNSINTNYESNSIAAFGLLCQSILEYDQDAESKNNGKANYNRIIIRKLKEQGKKRQDFSSFNTCYVAEEYQCIGLQRLLLRLMEELAKEGHKKGVVVTVSDKNEVSINNFKSAGYERVGKVNYEPGKYSRDFLQLTIE